MPDITVTYEKPETLKILKEISKYFGFTISASKTRKNKEITTVNGVTMRRKSDDVKTINNAEMNDIMERGQMDAKKLRSQWQRKK